MDNIIDFLRIGKINIIGSYTDKNKYYYSDIDIDDYVVDSKSEFLSKFRYKLKQINKNPSIYFIEFKAGLFGGRGIKWTYNEIMDGYRYIDNKRIDLLGTLEVASNIKLDLIVLDKNDLLLPVTVSYKFSSAVGDTRGYQTSVYLEAQKFGEENKLFEMYKKLYLYYKSKGDRKRMNDSLNVLNSELGSIYTNLYKLKEIKRLLDSDNKYNLKDIIYNFRDIQKNLPNDISYVMLPLVNGLSLDSIKRNIDKPISVIDKYINEQIKNLE